MRHPLIESGRGRACSEIGAGAAMKIGATIQARMGSSRLPGKVLKPILGKPMLELQWERIRQSRLIDEVIVATSAQRQDDPIAQWAKRLGLPCFRGSENDVLSRVAGALRSHPMDLHVEFLGDSPLPDPLIVDAFIGYFLKHSQSLDLVTNALKTTYPPGAEVTVYRPQTLLDAADRAGNTPLREHVSCHITSQPERYRLCNLEAPPQFHYPDLYLEVDSAEDFEVISAIYEHFYAGRPGFGLGEIIRFMAEHPELAARNRHVERRWKVFRNG